MKIGVIGRYPFTKLLRKTLNKKFTITHFKDFNSSNLRKFKEIDVLISMTWGKSVWGGQKNKNIPETTNLKLIHLPGSGIDGIDFSLVPKGCKVCNVYEHQIPISEFIIASLLNWEIKLNNKINKFKSYSWEDSMLFSKNPHGELNNKKIAILGYGRIGKELAKKLKAFKTQTTIISRKKIIKDKNFIRNLVVSEMNKYLKEFDYLVIACDLNNSSLNIISKNEFDAMKNNCVIVNIARGPIVNEKDLFFALKNKIIGGAIIDTWYRHPEKKDIKKFKPSIFNFGKLKNVVMTPHLSAHSESLVKRRIKLISQNIVDLKANRKLINVVYEN